MGVMQSVERSQRNREDHSETLSCLFVHIVFYHNDIYLSSNTLPAASAESGSERTSISRHAFSPPKRKV
jgi:hypothetical protein